MQVHRIGDRYELIEKISSGGMGSVWRGYDAVLDRQVAVKTIRLDQVVDGSQAAEFVERFRREARVTARIRHHGVPQVFDAVLDASFESVYLVMELIDGVALQNYIDPVHPLPFTWVAAVAAQIATVLSHAHALPVVHRDLKPSNVLITRDGSVKVIDFGIAALLDDERSRITRTGQQIGTFRYMAPERVHGQQGTPLSDLYALGCVMHEMITGNPLFDAASEYLVQRRHVEEEPIPLRELGFDVPAEFERLVLDLVGKDPSHRPADAYTVYERLLPFLPAPGAPVPPTELYLPGYPDPTRVFRRPNAPLEIDQVEPTRFGPAPAEPTAPLSAQHLSTAIAAADERYWELMEEGRFDQAADVLAGVLASAAESNGPDNAGVLGLRKQVAVAWQLSGADRRAVREFDALAAAYRRVEGRFSAAALACRAAAARSRMALGDVPGGLAELEQVVADLSAAGGDGTELSLDLRFEIGELKHRLGDREGAREMLQTLRDDLGVLRGPDDTLTREVVALLSEL
ncbi:serine/threonine-protein kinase [Nocardia puris]|uniref:non-specific serine/threonine protein kinase n=1 Tax=Nocardia puris TaxID=208602 RepID=A0A366DQT8_9NOCA|nr:serine/threonine-protein kinase [Nocardia puris]RBO92471.1 serine/threonine protein kinase [Nocardia puris]